jgi:hypothetical protein
VATPAQVDVWAGLDVGKGGHFADVLDDGGERVFARAVASDQADLEALLDRAARHGTPGLVIGQPGSIAQLALAVAARRDVPVVYVPGLVMRRAADLYPGEAKTDRRDACVLAGTGRTRRKQVHWLDAGSDELLAALRVLNGSGIDLAADAARLARRLRDALTSISPARSRRGGHRLNNAMFLAAFAALRDPASKASCDRKRAEGKRHNAALICLARRRCDVILAMLRTGEHYHGARKAQPARLADAA